VLLRSDVIRKTLLGVASNDRLNKEAYSEEVSLRVYQSLVSRAKKLLECGHAAIVDAVFLDADHRGMIEQVATELAVPFEGIWLQAPAATLLRRVESRRGDASDATSAVVKSQLRVDPGPMTWRRLDAAADEASVAEMAQALLAEGSAR
jgi:hypothetical protein